MPKIQESKINMPNLVKDKSSYLPVLLVATIVILVGIVLYALYGPSEADKLPNTPDIHQQMLDETVRQNELNSN